MDKNKFLELQYQTLRGEIEDSRERLFKITVGGATIVPAAQFLAKAYEIDALTLLLPFFVIIIMLLFLSENNAIMRCGQYIRTEIEPRIKSVIGWEKWLESYKEVDTRAVDRHLASSFYVLAFMYYLVSVYLASKYAYMEIGILGIISVLAFYIPIGFWIAYVLRKGMRFTTMITSEKDNS